MAQNKTPSKQKRIKRAKIVRPTKKKSEWLYQYMNLLSREEIIINEAFIERFAKDYVSWAANNDKAFIVREFRLSKGIDEQTWQRWIDAFPALKEANQMVVDIIGMRREKLALEREIDTKMTTYSMPMYSKDWKELVKWRSELKQKEEDKKGNITVVMEKFSEDDRVPVRKSSSKDSDNLNK